MLRDSWLFVSGDMSVFVVRSGLLEIGIRGPGAVRRTIAVQNRDDLMLFLRLHAEVLLEEGFSYEGFGADRRSAPRDDLRTTFAPELDASPDEGTFCMTGATH